MVILQQDQFFIVLVRRSRKAESAINISPRYVGERKAMRAQHLIQGAVHAYFGLRRVEVGLIIVFACLFSADPVRLSGGLCHRVRVSISFRHHAARSDSAGVDGHQAIANRPKRIVIW